MEAERKADMTANQFLALHKCRKNYIISRIGIKSTTETKETINTQGFKEIKNAILKENNIRECITGFANKFILPSWYEFEESHEAEINRTILLHSRMGEYLSNYLQGDKYKTDVTLSVNLNQTVNDVYVGKVTVNADFIVTRGNLIEIIMFQSGMPSESLRARKLENLPVNSVFINLIYAAARAVYPKNSVTVTLFYLKNKDDKGTTYQNYEHKPGKNIVSHTFNDEEPLTHLFNALSFKCDRNCDSCNNQKLCKTSKYIPAPVKKNERNITSDYKPTDEQLKVIKHINGPMLVEAVPGAGKTASLVKRQKNLTDSGISPSNILMITFTKKARSEILERVSGIIDGDCLPVIETFNSFGYNILRENPKILGECRLADETDKKEITLQALKSCAREGIMISNMQYAYVDGDYGLINTVFDYFEKIESNGKECFKLQYENKKDVNGIFKVYDRYKEILANGNYINYDEQVSLVVRMFKENPSILSNYQEIYKYIMVDEYQDINDDQFELIFLLSSRYKNIVCVGDTDQAIYGFRGGTIKYSLSFKEYFPDAQIVFMQDNFRCTDNIISAANTLITNNTERFDKKIIPHKSGNLPLLYSYLPYGGEKRIIDNLCTKYKPEDIAVIAVSNKSLLRFGEKIDPTGGLSPKDYLINDAVFLSIRDILEIKAKGTADDSVLARLLLSVGASLSDFPEFKNTSDTLHNRLYINGYIPELIPLPLDSDIKHKETSLWEAGVKLRKTLYGLSFTRGIKESVSCITKNLFGILEHPVINALSEIADERLITSSKSLLCVINNMIRFKSSKRVGYDSTNRLNLLTAHDSKGKEFSCVIIDGIDEFRVSEESRRLLYVALTRAKETLIIIENMNTENMLPEFKHCLRQMYLRERRAG